jgi:hypothetical protein
MVKVISRLLREDISMRHFFVGGVPRPDHQVVLPRDTKEALPGPHPGGVVDEVDSGRDGADPGEAASGLVADAVDAEVERLRSLQQHEEAVVVAHHKQEPIISIITI